MTNLAIDYQLLFDSASEANVILLPDFSIAAVNDAYVRLTTIRPSDVVGKNFSTMFSPNLTTSEKDILKRSFEEAVHRRTAQSVPMAKYEIRDRDGAYRLLFVKIVNTPVLNADQELAYVIHHVEDLSGLIHTMSPVAWEALKEVNDPGLIFKVARIQEISLALAKALSDLQASEKNAMIARSLLQAAMEDQDKVLMFSIDGNFRYLFFNKAFQTSTNAAYGTTVRTGMHLLDSITVEADREKARVNCTRAFNGETHVTLEEYGDRNKYYFETRYTPVRNQQGEVIGVSVESSNVTERILAEAQIEELTSELDSFTYSVSHDLRAPLRAIDGYASILRESAPETLDEEGRRLLNVIIGNARKMGRLIDDLLSFSRAGKLPLKLHPIDVDILLKKVIDEQSETQEVSHANIEIGKLEPVRCDGTMMQQVFANLVSNAMKFSRHRNAPVIQIGSEKKLNEVVYYVRDNGVGFDMQFSHKLFGVFQRLHRTTEFDGTGVGLAMVHRIITRHGGKVWAEAEVDKGATFYFSLPD